MPRRRTTRIKGGHLWWNNSKKTTRSKQLDCLRWNRKDDTQEEFNKAQEKCAAIIDKTPVYEKYYYPGSTNLGRTPHRLDKTPMTRDDWCKAISGISSSKILYLKRKKVIDNTFKANQCTKPPISHNSIISDYVSLSRRG